MAELNTGDNSILNSENISDQVKIRTEKLFNLQKEGKDPFTITKYGVTHHSADIKDNFESLENKPVSVAGRIMSKRVMGKASFCTVQDLRGSIQSYVSRDGLGETSYAEFKKLDIGDIVGISGTVFKTQTGVTFTDYLTGVRVNKARELLEGTNKSMKEICSEVGYSDPNYFSRIFKKNTGVTPTEYKEGKR